MTQPPAEAEAPARRASIGPQRSPHAREAILAAAEAVLVEKGPKGFSIEAVARAAKAGKPTIYRWWPSRAALLLEVYHARKTQVAIAETEDLAADLATFLDRLFAHWRNPGCGAVFRSVIAEAQADPEAAAAFAGYAAERRAHMADLLARARDRGALRPDARPELVADMIQTFAWGRLLTGRIDPPPDEIAAAVRQILEGAGAQGR